MKSMLITMVLACLILTGCHLRYTEDDGVIQRELELSKKKQNADGIVPISNSYQNRILYERQVFYGKC